MPALNEMRHEPINDPDTHCPRSNPKFTEAVIGQLGPKADERSARLFKGMVMHLHAFMREEKVTEMEFQATMKALVEASKNGEIELLIYPFGVGGLATENTFNIENPNGIEKKPTRYTGIGPFYRPNAPIRENRSSIVSGFKSADHVLMHGRILDSSTGKPLRNAELDIWQAGTNGLYDHLDPSQPEWNLRGRFLTQEDGTYSLICLRPTHYPIYTEGVSGKFLKLIDRHPYRPGHIHVIVRMEGYLPLVTELYERGGKFVDSDAVFDVWDDVVVDVRPREDGGDGEVDGKVGFELEYEFRLISLDTAGVKGMRDAVDWCEGGLGV